ncbi:hypothetical protein BAUCODRAFT_37515 [Baudoinia panamericana UAMH 10762]|uniref:Ketoreductase domain-containing protein n=1 Tax=Baudoinia panamericana (strain UAMH 10762) TaxID=717646 RepID=M2M8C6_BAUPA|nr:uncharacterized protein BAUCODRAFT_37515 [Baudoinia panamericana UAMH 10762]EMC92621.1 hypothetical protein BAUCODRAFT_37515 [Baudoinia panamericana UAMH 10762]
MVSTKVVILTGASRGIGLAIAHYLLQRSHQLVVLSRSEGPLRELEKQYMGQVAVLVGDLADLSLGKKAVSLAIERFERLDAVIVNHGVLDPVQRVSASTVEAWRAAFDVNFFSAVALSQAALPKLRDSKGTIIFTSSGAATNDYPTWGAYGASKAALNHLAATLASEEKAVTSMAIRPGVVDTEMQRDIRERHFGTMEDRDRARFGKLSDKSKLLKPEQPGHVMAKLVLEPPKDLNGKFLSWDSEELKAYQE